MGDRELRRRCERILDELADPAGTAPRVLSPGGPSPPAARPPNRFGTRTADDPLSSELADIMLRTLELAEDLGIDLGAAIAAKAADTVVRYRHGGVRF